MDGFGWATRMASAFHGVVLDEDNALVHDGRADSPATREEALRTLRAGFWASAHRYDRIPDVDTWIQRAAGGDADAGAVLLQWCGWNRPRGGPGVNRKGANALAKTLIHACANVPRLDARLAKALETLTYVDLLRDEPALQSLGGRIEPSVFQAMKAQLAEIDARDRTVIDRLRCAKKKGDFL